LVEKITIDVNKITKKPIKSTEIIVESFYDFSLPPSKSPRDLWAYSEILDDLVNRGIKDIRMYTNEGMFFIDTDLFVKYGTIKRGKVYINLDASTFDVYPNGDAFNVDVKVIK
jgi:hypothetical protein